MTRAVLAVAVLAGCTVPKSGVGSGDAIVTVTWSVRSVTGAEDMCPAGTTAAQVLAQPVDPTQLTPEGPPISTLFDCDAKSGTVELLPATYIFSVLLEDAGGSDIYASSLSSGLVDIGNVVTSETFDIYTDGGYLSLNWELIDPMGALQDCEASAVQDVRIVATPKSGSGAVIKTNPMPCDDFADITSVMPAGDYSLAIDAEENGGTVGTFAVADEMVLAPNLVSGLGGITIPVGTN